MSKTSGVFDDGKHDDALRTIGEVARALGIKPHVLRYWEEQFPMLRPVKRSGSRRYYRPGDVVLVQTIDRLLNREGYTIKGAVRALRSGSAGEEPVPHAALTPDPRMDRGAESELVARLKRIRETLAQALV